MIVTKVASPARRFGKILQPFILSSGKKENIFAFAQHVRVLSYRQSEVCFCFVFVIVVVYQTLHLQSISFHLIFS